MIIYFTDPHALSKLSTLYSKLYVFILLLKQNYSTYHIFKNYSVKIQRENLYWELENEIELEKEILEKQKYCQIIMREILAKLIKYILKFHLTPRKRR